MAKTIRHREVFLLAACCILLAGCNGSGLGLRGVGAAPPPQKQVVAAPPLALEQEDAVVRAARQEELQRGTTLNVAAPASVAEPVPLVPAQIPPEPQMAATREEAITQIRQKAKTDPDEKPNVFDITRSPVPRLDERRRERETELLRQAAQANRDTLSPEEANAKAKASKSLQYRARTHYEQAVKNIEN